ncbi:ribonuclease E [Oxalobacteraceae bacterium GrIS 2.11]
MKRMLFNATQQEELRVAIVDGQKLIDIDIETAGRELRKSNIYKGVVTRIEPSLEACFVNYGEDRHGFLPFKEVARSYFKEGADPRNASIKEALREGQEIMVQVEKEERGNKGAALTSFVSLAGRYLVLMPNNPRGGGVSRRVEGEDRQELRDTMDKLDLPNGMSVIARTAGIGRNVDELQWDLNYLMQLWRAIEGANKSASGAFLIYQESSLVIRAIRDYFQPDIGEILIDTDDIYEQAQQFMSHVMPDMVHRVKRYSDDVPLFSRFQIEHQIETAYSRTVPLPSGGAIVIDHTEALVSVDVNSARATRGGDIETTAFNTNCEAAEEVARQLRLRDLGGLIVIDFIDMENTKNQREVETRLKDALRYDRARVQMGKISRFGLMELSRQRLRPSLSEGSHVTCPRCNGTGHIRDTESSALQVLRIIQEEAMKENSAAIHCQVPVDVAAFLLNEKRGEILKLETRHRVTVILIPNKHLETPHYKLDRLKSDDPRLEENHASYAMAEEADTDIGYSKGNKEDVKPRQEAMVKSITPDTAPIVERPEVVAPKPVIIVPPAKPVGFFGKLLGWLTGSSAEPEALVAAVSEEPAKTERPQRGNADRNNRNRSRGRNNRNAEEKPVVAAAAAVPAAKQVKPVVADAANPDTSQRPPKGPRPPRPERESQEARRERQQREREERAAKKAAEPVVTPVPAQAKLLPESDDDGVESDDNLDQVGKEAEGGGDEPRRRRRRGGRNRNRRDREAGDVGTPEQAGRENSDDFVPVADIAHAEQHLESQLDSPVAETVIEPAVHAHTALEIATEATAAHVDEPVAHTVVIAAEPFMPIPVPAAHVETHVETAVPTQVELKFEPVVEVSHHVHAEPVGVAHDEPAQVEAIVEHAAAVNGFAAVPVPESAAVEAVANTVVETKAEDLNEMLKAAGLVLTATDPDKLRTAQTYVAPVTEVRPARARKAPVEVSNEPLQLVQTKPTHPEQ